MWMEGSSRILCSWVQHHARGSNPAWPRGSEKTLFIRPARHCTSHPAHIQRSQEAEPKLLVNWEQKQMFLQFMSQSGFTKLQHGETLCCTAGIQRSVQSMYVKSMDKAQQGLQQVYKCKTLTSIAPCSSEVFAQLFFLSNSSVKISHAAATGRGQAT